MNRLVWPVNLATGRCADDLIILTTGFLSDATCMILLWCKLERKGWDSLPEFLDLGRFFCE